MTAALARATLAGVYDPHASLGADEAGRALRHGSEAFGDADVVVAGPLAALRSPRAPWSRSDPPGVFCLLAGRLYNLDDLCQELGAPSETEPETVVAAVYSRFGPSVLERLAGSFALLLWDGNARHGFIAQDQLGTRSVYYCEQGSRLWFASDVVALLRLLPRGPAPDEVTMVHRVSNSDPPIERTSYEGVWRLTGGHVLELEDGRWRRRRYWEPRYRSPSIRSLDEVRAGLWAAVSRAVRSRMGKAERLGIIMSGGIDSTAVATAAMEAARNGRPSPRGYSAVFPGFPQVDETERIQLLADGIGIPSIQIEPTPGGMFPLMLEYMKRWEIPVTGPGYLLERPLVERAAADGIAALLDGQGGDELFGLSPYLIADHVRRGRIVSSIRLARRLPVAFEHAPWQRTIAMWRVFGVKGAMPYRPHAAARRRRGRYVPQHLARESAVIFAETDDALAWKRNPAGPLWWTFKAHLVTRGREKSSLPEYLRHRAAMVGVESRPPLMDLNLVEFALSIPPELDFDSRYDRPNIRESLKGSVPDALRLDRRKSNLAAFYHHGWIERDLPLVRNVLLSRDVEVQRFVRPGYIADLLDDPPPVGGKDWMLWGPKVWGLLAVECFLQHQADPEWATRLLNAPELALPSSRVIAAPA